MRVLDLFCGAGGAAMGLHRAWPDAEIIGVDIVKQPRYPFAFVQADALKPPFDLSRFDFIWASPPCQGYTTMNNRHGSSIPKLLEHVRAQLRGLPHVIENVPGARQFMTAPFELVGEMFGLGVHRPRLFESSVLILNPPRPKRQHNPVAVYGKQDGRRLWTRKDGTEHHVSDLETARTGMGIDWMSWDELREAIPPAYSEFIARQFIQ